MNVNVELRTTKARPGGSLLLEVGAWGFGLHYQIVFRILDFSLNTSRLVLFDFLSSALSAREQPCDQRTPLAQGAKGRTAFMR